MRNVHSMRELSVDAILKAMLSHLFSNIFYLDLRSLAIFRIGLGLVSFYNLYVLYPDIDAFFGAQGIAPLSHFRLDMPWSLYAISDHYYYIRILFFFHFVLAFMLTFGIKTRLATVACFVMTLSIFNRLLPIEYGADKVLRIFLFWGIFLPLGARYSFDKFLSRKNELQNNAYASVASGAFICQLIMIYTFTALARTHDCWLKENTALFYGFQYFSYLTKPFATWLLNFPELLKSLTFLLYRIELFGGFLLFIPFCSWFWRSIVIILFVALHLGVFLTFNLNPFPALMIFGWMALIPTIWWGKKNSLSEKVQYEIQSKHFSFLIVLILGIVIWLNCRFVLTLHQQMSWKPTQIERLFENVGLKQRWSMFHMNHPHSGSRWSFIPIYENYSALVHKRKDAHLRNFDTLYWINLSEQIATLEHKRYLPFVRNYVEQQWRKDDPQIVSVLARLKTWFIAPSNKIIKY